MRSFAQNHLVPHKNDKAGHTALFFVSVFFCWSQSPCDKTTKVKPLLNDFSQVTDQAFSVSRQRERIPKELVLLLSESRVRGARAWCTEPEGREGMKLGCWTLTCFLSAGCSCTQHFISLSQNITIHRKIHQPHSPLLQIATTGVLAFLFFEPLSQSLFFSF